MRTRNEENTKTRTSSDEESICVSSSLQRKIRKCQTILIPVPFFLSTHTPQANNRLSFSRLKTICRPVIINNTFIRYTMMLRYVCVAVLPTLGRSFAPRSLPLAARILSTSLHSSHHQPGELEKEMIETWVDLQKKGRRLEENPISVRACVCVHAISACPSKCWLVVTVLRWKTRAVPFYLSQISLFSQNDWVLQADALELAEEVLELAVAYTHTKELVEETHVQSAHAAVEDALEMEKVLETAEKEANQDIAEAEHYLEDHVQSPWRGDNEKRRQAVVADISHRVENYVESRLAEAQQAEQRAREAEDRAQHTLEELQRREADLKATLDELKLYRLREETQL